MNSLAFRLRWLQAPAALLILLLQRTPVLRCGLPLERWLTGGTTALLRSGFVVAALGAWDTLAGATTLSASPASPATANVGEPFALVATYIGAPGSAGAMQVTGTLPPGLVASGSTSIAVNTRVPVAANGVTNARYLWLTGTPTAAGTYQFNVVGWEKKDAKGGSKSTTYRLTVAGAVASPPAFSSAPTHQMVAPGAPATFAAAASGAPNPTYQWFRNGQPLAGATGPSYTVTSVQPADAGVYSVVATNAQGAVTSPGAILGVYTTELYAGAAFSDPAWRTIRHPNGNSYTQVLLTGSSATVTADPGKTTRLSFIDLQDDIVQLEFSGAGTMTVTLENATGPAVPLSYNQNVQYMKGHASVVIQGADASTYVSAFSVGSLTAVNQALFRGDVSYDGHADLARLVIESPTGQFGGIFMANAAFGATAGDTGIYAPGVAINYHVRLHDLRAFAGATPVLLFGGTPNPEDGVRITGGDLAQANGRAIQLRGVNRVLMAAGTDAHNRFEAPLANQARFERDGVDVTAAVVVPPTGP